MLKWTLSHSMIGLLGLFAMSDACLLRSRPVVQSSSAGAALSIHKSIEFPVGFQPLKQYDLLGRNRKG